MDGLAFVSSLPTEVPMPMARFFSLRLLSVAHGSVTAVAVPSAEHYNPFQVVQGGFAATVLDIVLGLVSITVLKGDATGVATTDLSVRYIRSIREATGELTIRGSVIHNGNSTVVAEAKLEDGRGNLLATAQCTSIVLRRERAV